MEPCGAQEPGEKESVAPSGAWRQSVEPSCGEFEHVASCHHEDEKKSGCLGHLGPESGGACEKEPSPHEDARNCNLYLHSS